MSLFKRQLNKLTTRIKHADADAFRVAIRDEYELYSDAPNNSSPAQLKTAQKALKSLQKSLYENAPTSPRFDARLDGDELGEAGEVVLTRALIAGPKSLRQLTLSNCNLTAASIERLKDYLTSPSTQLESFCVSGNPLGDAGVASLLTAVLSCPSITELSLVGVGLTPAGLSSLSEFLRTTRTPRSIDLSRNAALDAASVARILDDVSSNVFIVGLKLDGLPVSAQQLAQLKAVLARNDAVSGVLDTLIGNACRRNFKSRLNGFRQSMESSRLLLGLSSASSDAVNSPAFRWFPKSRETNTMTPSFRFEVGHVADIGRRREMQDVVCIRGAFRERKTQDFFALFDGHGGRNAAAYCADRIPAIVADNLARSNDMHIESALGDSFMQCHKEMAGWATISGTTAVALLIVDSRRYIAVAGDSRLVLSRGGKVAFATDVHKATVEAERQRVLALGGVIENDRVNGQLSVTRAIGDANLCPYVTAEPDVYIQDHDDDDDFILMASDGVWDVMTPEVAIQFVHERLARFAELSEADRERLGSVAMYAADALKDEVFRKGSNDNISAVIVAFRKNGGRRISRTNASLPSGLSLSTQLDPIFSASDSDLHALVEREVSPTSPVPPPPNSAGAAERPVPPSLIIDASGPPPLATGPFGANARRRTHNAMGRRPGAADDSVLSHMTEVQANRISRAFHDEMMLALDHVSPEHSPILPQETAV